VITYVDTSSLIKVLIDEPGSAAAAALWDSSDTLAQVRIGYVEARAALAAAHRGGRLTGRQLTSTKLALDELWAQLAVVEVTVGLVLAAAELAETQGLRGYDAVHLAAAIEIGADVVASADGDLVSAAGRVGLHTANPDEV
jgi:predicted nucleic acid-binding protein